MEIDFKFIEEIIEVIKNAYDETKQIKDKNIKNKELNDIVTDVDIFMENRIVSFIKESFPKHSIYSEEIGEINKDSEYEWLIDPIDGTINFASGLPLFATSAIELAWCASGKIDGCLNVKPSIGLSSCAGKLLVQEAGGKVTNLQGNARENIDTMLVTNGNIHNEIVSVINNKI